MPHHIGTALARLDLALAGAQRRARRALGRVESVRLVAYRSWVTPSKAVVLARAVQADLALEAQLQRWPRVLRVMHERFWTLEAPPVPVRAGWEGQVASATSDAGGFIEVSFPLNGAAPQVSTRAELALAGSPGAASAVVEVFGLHPGAAFGVISDIDDTVLETELTNPWRRFLQLIYSRQTMRLPFDGIAALYQAFAQAHNPIFYVSNAPWNLYEHVVELLDHHSIPRGPVLLRDSRLAERIVRDPLSGRVSVHKQRALRRIVEEHPDLPFVLLGDSSRRDPLRYVEVAEAFPGRVAAIYIRRVYGPLARRGSLEQLRRRAETAGVELLVADDTVTIARHARSRGFVPAEEVGRVREGQARDAQAPPIELAAAAAASLEEPR
ncbi:MAG TPA: phosphatase domain-containing protein [Polyangiaceae bacterium]|jgi:phosphatidate phosphatase APP1|nr:phosphatase domain-containing protein [Polyangiaceae bacterium]